MDSSKCTIDYRDRELEIDLYAWVKLDLMMDHSLTLFGKEAYYHLLDTFLADEYEIRNYDDLMKEIGKKSDAELSDAMERQLIKWLSEQGVNVGSCE